MLFTFLRSAATFSKKLLGFAELASEFTLNFLNGGELSAILMMLYGNSLRVIHFIDKSLTYNIIHIKN